MVYMYSLPGQNGAAFEEATYEGEFRAGKREGKGTITWQDGTQFSGMWRNDERYDGEHKCPNGTVYRGPFSNDKMHGLARVLLSSGVFFEGHFE